MSDSKEKFNRNHFILMFFAFSFGMILSNLIAQQKPQENKSPESLLFVYKGIDQTVEQISEPLRKKLIDLENERKHILELAAIELHVFQYAHDNKISLNEASMALLPFKPVNEERVAEFYRTNEDLLGKPYFEVKDVISKRLQDIEVEKSKRVLLDTLQENGDLAFFHH